MAMTPEEIKILIKKHIDDAEIVLHALKDDGDHYAAEVTSKHFIGKNKIFQHKMVYDALEGHMGTTLHALSLTTKIPKGTFDV